MKLGRNEQCHCGSGKKYKKCCLRKDEEAARLARLGGGPTGAISFSTASESVAAAVQVEETPVAAEAQGGDLEVGKQYVIQPANPRKTKNRDRQCELLSLLEDGKAEVKFLDTNRKGKVEAEDLVLVG